jgi:hypothetical protein
MSVFYVRFHVYSSHAFAGGPDRQTWIDLCQRASLDPYGLINKYFDKLFGLVLDAACSESKVCLKNRAQVAGADFIQYGFPEASYSVVTTLCFVSPATVLPQIVKQLQDDLDLASLNALSDLDLGVWATPEGTTFVDGYYFVFQWFIIALNLKNIFLFSVIVDEGGN